MDQMVSIFCGAMFILAGIGCAFGKTDESARIDDENRFGPLSIANMGPGYAMLRNKWCKILVILSFWALGISFVLNGYGLLRG
jgi:hypothetical protein